MRRAKVRRGWAIGAVVAVLVFAVVIAAAAGGDGAGSTGGESVGTRETAKVKVQGSPLLAFQGNDAKDVAVGMQAPTLIGEGFDGNPVTIEPTGKPQVVMFLAHWCPHCQTEVPRVVELASGGAFDGIDVASVPTGTNRQYPNYPPSAWLALEKWPFEVLLDSPRSTAAEAYGLSAYPFFVFLDGDGAVLGRATGEIESTQLTEILDAMRAGASLPSAGSSSSSSVR